MDLGRMGDVALHGAAYRGFDQVPAKNDHSQARLGAFFVIGDRLFSENSLVRIPDPRGAYRREDDTFPFFPHTVPTDYNRQPRGRVIREAETAQCERGAKLHCTRVIRPSAQRHKCQYQTLISHGVASAACGTTSPTTA